MPVLYWLRTGRRKRKRNMLQPCPRVLRKRVISPKLPDKAGVWGLGRASMVKGGRPGRRNTRGATACRGP